MRRMVASSVFIGFLWRLNDMQGWRLNDMQGIGGIQFNDFPLGIFLGRKPLAMGDEPSTDGRRSVCPLAPSKIEACRAVD